MENKGLIHIYCGDGKGKTTAAIGLAIRAAGAGMKVLIYQFMKSNTSSERSILEQIPDILVKKGMEIEKFSSQMTEPEKEERRIFYKESLIDCMDQAGQQKIGLLVLDEILYTIRAGLLLEEDLLDCLKNKPAELEVVLTGRDPGEKLRKMADYISVISKEKHPFDQGIPARIGIEK